MKYIYLLFALLLLNACQQNQGTPKPDPDPSLTLSSDLSTRTNLDPFTLHAEVKNFPDVAKVEFFRGANLIGSVTTMPYEHTVSDWQFGVFTDDYRAKASNTSGKTISSELLPIAVNVVDALLISPQESLMLAGGAAASFEASLRTENDSALATVAWTLEGPGDLSVPNGTQTLYTPPAALDAETTATVTGTLPDGRSARGVVTLKPATPSGNLYNVSARVFGVSTDIFVSESISMNPFPSAVVKVNGTTINFVGGRFQGGLAAPLTAGETVDLEIVVPEGTIHASVMMPAAPLLTAPVDGSSQSAADPLELIWTMPEDPTSFRLGYGTVPYESELAASLTLTGESRSQVFTDIPADKTLAAYVIAINTVIEATGPVATSFELNAENSDASSRSTITTTP